MSTNKKKTATKAAIDRANRRVSTSTTAFGDAADKTSKQLQNYMAKQAQTQKEAHNVCIRQLNEIDAKATAKLLRAEVVYDGALKTLEQSTQYTPERALELRRVFNRETEILARAVKIANTKAIKQRDAVQAKARVDLAKKKKELSKRMSIKEADVKNALREFKDLTQVPKTPGGFFDRLKGMGDKIRK